MITSEDGGSAGHPVCLLDATRRH